MLSTVLYVRAPFSLAQFLSHRRRLDDEEGCPSSQSPAPSYHRSADVVGKLPGHMPADEEAAGARLLLRGGGAGNGRVYRRKPAVGVARSVFISCFYGDDCRVVIRRGARCGQLEVSRPSRDGRHANVYVVLGITLRLMMLTCRQAHANSCCKGA